MNGAGFLVLDAPELALAFLAGTGTSFFISAVAISKVKYM